MIHTVTTAIIVLFLLASSASYVFHQGTIEGVRALGFPDAFRWQLAMMKFAAALALALPFTPALLREWAYAGTAFFLITAMVAHYAHGDPIALNLLNVALLAVLAVAYVTK
jgi:hypothetical protein